MGRARAAPRRILPGISSSGPKPNGRRGPPTEWLADYGRQIDNLRAALDWAFSPGGDASIGVALTAAAVPLWMHLSLMEECRGRVERALAADRGRGGRGRAPRDAAPRRARGIADVYQRCAVTEVGAAGTKALEIAENLGHAEYQLRSLWGLWIFHFNTGQHCVALILAQRFHTLAAKRPDPIDRLIGERMIGTSQYYLGDIAQCAAPSRARARPLCRAGPEVANRSLWGRRAGGMRGPTLPGSCGCRDCRIRRCAPPKAVSRTLARPIKGSHWVRLWPVAACPVALWVGDLAAAEQYVEMLLDKSTRPALTRWGVFGRCYQGMLVIQRGDLSNGLQLLRAAFGEPAAAGSAPRLFAFLISAASGHAGQIADGLPAIEEAIMRSEHTEERWLIAELLRVKGELVLLRGAPGGTGGGRRSLPAGARFGRPARRAGLGVARRHEPCATAGPSGSFCRCDGSPPASLRPIYRRVRDRRSQGGKGVARRSVLILDRGPLPGTVSNWRFGSI